MVVINEASSMFWGVTIDAGKRYSQVVKQTFHLSMAALEPGDLDEFKSHIKIKMVHIQYLSVYAPKYASSNECVQVMLQHNSSDFLLCSLIQGKILQQPLDLLFATGEELSFSLVGKGVVHLSGYLLNDEPEDYDDFSDEEDSDAPQLVEIDEDSLKTGSKRKAIAMPMESKKTKLSDAFDGIDDDDEDEDEDYSEDDLTFDEDEDSDDDDDDEDDDDEDDEEDDEEEEEEAPTPVIKTQKKPVLTPKGDNLGSAKKDKQGNNKSAPSTPKTPASQNKKNEQKQNETTPETPSTPANDESAKKKKKKKKKNKDASMNESSSASPGKSSNESTPQSGKKKSETTPKIETPGKRKVVAGGTVVEDVKVGHGPEAKPGKMVSVYYIGTLSKTNKRFDSCTNGKPFRFRLKQGEVIKGWDNGLEGMKVGGKRKITVPANQAYGSQRQGPIPPNSALTFEVELKAVS